MRSHVADGENEVFVTKMDERGRQWQTQLQFMERNGKALEELVARMLRIREEQEAFHRSFTKSMQDMGALEETKALAQCFNALGDSGLKMANETHDVMMQRPETEILQVLTQIQDWGIVPMKRLVDDREKAIKIEQKLQKEYDEKSRSGSGKEREKKLRMLSDQKRRVENVNALIELHMRRFEQFRTEKLKKVLTELARSNAFYHAKGLESFALPCALIGKLNPGDIGEEVP
ncbi:hypothetical protein Poli38472_003302 [Pythium oligandrum]|uniref:Uncharacterized protein n=1 Tax=Pythium oligandrum TaxID=41045 RepID=A0A8K1FF74_PYTOL|nr:hypothetical protein Poli38472_003302 [Pythium oligandrum]|eukprot:TMW57377.1 hypothetical protein Poli38472_003302 [Pythium oligandrum]